MGFAGAALFLSFVLYVLNVGHSVWSARAWTLTRAYMAASLALPRGGLHPRHHLGQRACAVAPLVSHHAWAAVGPPTGLVGWLALTVMGVSYQLAPMFNVITEARPRWGWQALAITVGAVVLFATAIAFDPPPWARPILAAVLALGPLLWGADQLRLMRHRSRRRLDVQGRAVFPLVGIPRADRGARPGRFVQVTVHAR
jgi:hypothetical protein